MHPFEAFLNSIDSITHKAKTKEVLDWIEKTYPNLDLAIKWNQPMFTHKNTYIIGFSVAKKHLACSPEQKTIDIFKDQLTSKGYHPTSMIFRIGWDQDIDYQLLKEMIDYNIKDKKDYERFWR